jgi:hypothetical protein
MQPTNDEPAAGTSGWAGPTYAPPIPSATVKKGRPWLVAIVSTLTLLVLIAAIGNQWVIDAIARHFGSNDNGSEFARTVNTYSWRFSPRGGHDFARYWISSICLVVVVLVLTFLLVAAICRGPGSFVQSFFGAWAVVVVATLLAVYVRDAVLDTKVYLGSVSSGKVNAIFFSPVSPGTLQVLAGLAFGFVVGLAAGLTAVLSRRTEVVAPAVPPGYGAPAFGQPGDPYGAAAVPGPIASPSPWGGSGEREADNRPGDDQRTQAMPVVDAPNRDTDGENTEATTQLPRADGQRSTSEPPSDGQHTTELPRSTTPDEDDPEGPRHLSD